MNTPEQQAEINARAAEMRLETQLYKLRERLELTQQQQANAMSIAQSSFVAIEKRGAEVKLMATYKKLLEKRSPESRARIAARAAEIRQEITLAKLREELNVPQTQLAGFEGQWNENVR